jgi:hypothetical protein
MKSLSDCADSNYISSIQSSTSQNITNTENTNHITHTLEEDKNCIEEEHEVDVSAEEAFSSNSSKNCRSTPHCSRLDEPFVENSTLGSFYSEEMGEDEDLLCLLVNLIKIAPIPEWKLKFTFESVMCQMIQYLSALEDLYQLISIDFYSNSARNELSGYYRELHNNNEQVYSSLVLYSAYTGFILYPPLDKYYSLPLDIVQHASFLCTCFEITKQDFINSSKALINNTISLLEIASNLKDSLRELSKHWIAFENVLFFVMIRC